MLENSSPGGFSSCLIKHSCLSFSRNPENSENLFYSVFDLEWESAGCPGVLCSQILFSKNVSFLHHQRHKTRYSIYDDCYQTRFPKLSFAFRWTHDWKRLPLEWKDIKRHYVFSKTGFLKNIYRGFSVKKVFFKMSA